MNGAVLTDALLQLAHPLLLSQQRRLRARQAVVHVLAGLIHVCTPWRERRPGLLQRVDLRVVGL